CLYRNLKLRFIWWRAFHLLLCGGLAVEIATSQLASSSVRVGVSLIFSLIELITVAVFMPYQLHINNWISIIGSIATSLYILSFFFAVHNIERSSPDDPLNIWLPIIVVAATTVAILAGKSFYRIYQSRHPEPE